MVLTILITGLILLSGLIAGWAITVVAKNIAVLALGNQEKTANIQRLNLKEAAFRLIWIATGLVTLVTWLQPSYQEAPFYLFAVNTVLIWLLILIALVDWLTHLIFPKMLLAGVGLIGVILLAVSFLNASVGVVTDRITGVTKAVRGNSPEITYSTFHQLWPLNIYDSLAGVSLAGLVFGLLYLISRLITRKEVIGKGDLVLAGFVGLTLGLWRTIFALGIAVVLSLIVSSILLLIAPKKFASNRFIPYGPFLCAGAIYCLMFGAVFTLN